MATNQEYASALAYGPRTQSAMRRSKYLAAALEGLAQSSQKIQGGPLELAARLGATALLHRGAEKARGGLTEAMKLDQGDEASRLLAVLDQATAPMQQAQAAVPPPVAASAPSPPPVQAGPLPPAQPREIDPETDAMVRTVWGEARGEDALGRQGVAAVIRNRADERGLTPSQVVRQPKQFEPWSNPETRRLMLGLAQGSPEYQEILRDIQPVLDGQVPPQFSGADHFYSPTAQSSLGRAPPSWDNGKGADVGRHRFFNLEGDAPAGQMQPFQVAANGPLSPDMIPSVQGAASPAPVGPTPAASSPQAAAGVTYFAPTPEEISRARALMSDPRTFEQGRALALKLQERAVTPMKTDTVQMNGVPFARNPYTNELQPIGIPDAARTQTMTAQQAGLPTAPQGAFVQRDPFGNMKEAPFAPPEGYNASVVGGQVQHSPIQGGPNDPYAAQKPGAGYEYRGGVQAPIQGGPNDPRSIPNVLAGTKSLRDEIQPVMNQAIQVKRNMDAVRTGYGLKNGAGDIAMVNGLQRMIDDGVVREGDVALQLKAQGLAGTISGLRGFMSSDGFFTDPKVRDAVMAAADGLYARVNDTYRSRVMGYRGIADRAYGEGTFDNYVLTPDVAADLGWAAAPAGGPARPPAAAPPAPAAAAPQRAPVTREEAIQEARRRGLIR